ncbi:MAG: M4 family metallopeptidase [Vicinamibacterales bacterium]
MTIRTCVAAAGCVAAVTAAALLRFDPAHAQARDRHAQVLAARSLTELRADDERVMRMMRGGELRLRERRADLLVAGRFIERSDQFHRGVRVFGGDVARQVSAGQTVSVFGTLYAGIEVDTAPEVGEREARAVIEARTGVSLGRSRDPELVVLPLPSGGYALTWKLRAAAGADIREYFVDAGTGAVAFDYSDLQSQNAVGRATGVLGDSKKISTQSGAGGFILIDGLRPPSIRTYDMKGDPNRVFSVLNGLVNLGAGDVATDTDNEWTDGAVSDAHVYTGLTYDYYYRRYARKGLNDANVSMRMLVHPVNLSDFATYIDVYPTLFNNAFYAGGGYMVYGEGLPANVTSGGRGWNRVAGALDIVAHEVTHGVTQYTSNLIYRNESGALNESFSDIMGTAVEFFYQPPGDGLLKAEYLCGEDIARGATNGIRSLANPMAYGHPDHYSIRFLGSTDNGGVHTNSGISNHAFYLAVEGGTNRVSGLAVQGVGGANREQIERVFYRAFTQLMTANSTFAVARSATIQAAQDLYGAGSAPERAVLQAWTAVGVN